MKSKQQKESLTSQNQVQAADNALKSKDLQSNPKFKQDIDCINFVKNTQPRVEEVLDQICSNVGNIYYEKYIQRKVFPFAMRQRKITMTMACQSLHIRGESADVKDKINRWADIQQNVISKLEQERLLQKETEEPKGTPYDKFIPKQIKKFQKQKQDFHSELFEDESADEKSLDTSQQKQVKNIQINLTASSAKENLLINDQKRKSFISQSTISNKKQKKEEPKQKKQPNWGLKEIDSESFKNRFKDLSPRADMIDKLRQGKELENRLNLLLGNGNQKKKNKSLQKQISKNVIQKDENEKDEQDKNVQQLQSQSSFRNEYTTDFEGKQILIQKQQKIYKIPGRDVKINYNLKAQNQISSQIQNNELKQIQDKDMKNDQKTEDRQSTAHQDDNNEEIKPQKELISLKEIDKRVKEAQSDLDNQKKNLFKPVQFHNKEEQQDLKMLEISMGVQCKIQKYSGKSKSFEQIQYLQGKHYQPQQKVQMSLAQFRQVKQLNDQNQSRNRTFIEKKSGSSMNFLEQNRNNSRISLSKLQEKSPIGNSSPKIHNSEINHQNGADFQKKAFKNRNRIINKLAQASSDLISEEILESYKENFQNQSFLRNQKLNQKNMQIQKANKYQNRIKNLKKYIQQEKQQQDYTQFNSRISSQNKHARQHQRRQNNQRVFQSHNINSPTTSKKLVLKSQDQIEKGLMTNKTLSAFHVYNDFQNSKPDDQNLLLSRLESRQSRHLLNQCATSVFPTKQFNEKSSANLNSQTQPTQYSQDHNTIFRSKRNIARPMTAGIVKFGNDQQNQMQKLNFENQIMSPYGSSMAERERAITHRRLNSKLSLRNSKDTSFQGQGKFKVLSAKNQMSQKYLVLLNNRKNKQGFEQGDFQNKRLLSPSLQHLININRDQSRQSESFPKQFLSQ